MPIQLGSQGDLVRQWQRLMVSRFGSYATEPDGRPLRIDGYYGYSDQRVQTEWQRRVKAPQTGIVTDDDLIGLGLIKAPPKPAPKHSMLTFRGTGGIVGQDYTSRIAAACPAVTEVPVPYAASMGPLPVGAASDLAAPSGAKSRDAAVEWAARWIETTAASGRTFMLCGYSQGADAASRVRALLEPGGRLERHRDRYVAGVMIGNPARRAGHTFYNGAVPAGEGIADWHVPASACTWDWCELVQPGDLYACVPIGDIGDICRKAYTLVMNLQVTDLAALASAFLQNLMGLLDEAGIDPQGLQKPDQLIGGFIGGLISSLAPQLAPLVTANTNPEAVAASQAAVLGLKFAATQPPTLPHISYEWAQALPGMSYLGLGIQHVNHWAATRAAR